MEHEMRITTAGSVASYAAFALTFLSENPERPLVLHTRPADPTASSSKNTLCPSTLAAPRLVAVVEKVKREHATELWQYTATGLLEPVTEERPSLDRVLGGKTKPKLTHRPYLQITLSTRPLGLEKKRNVTCQRATPAVAAAAGAGAAAGAAAEPARKSGAKGSKDGAEALTEETEAATRQDSLTAPAPEHGQQDRRKRKSEAADGASKRART